MFGNIKMRYCNNLKTLALFSLIWLFVALMWIVAGSRLSMLIWFAIVATVLSVCAYWLSGKLAIRIIGASEVSENDEPVLYGIVREISAQIEKPMPHLYVAPTDSPNIFAIGRSERHATICCTRGLLNILNERELRGVVSHELIHVYNHDILNSTVASAIATIFTYTGYTLMYSGAKCAKSAKTRCPALRIAGKALSAIFAPVGSLFVDIAISSARELDADRSAGMLTGDPAALASALNKIAYGAKLHEMDLHSGVQAIASLMIVNPFANYDSKLLKLFSRQPAVKERVDCLTLMAKGQDVIQEDVVQEVMRKSTQGKAERADESIELDGNNVFRFQYGREYGKEYNREYSKEYSKGVSGRVVAVSGA
ncbi:M48 family metalloprotease [Gardnerella vaginalis]|uniref:M48 family metalloprotease n=1 Tax=Gardnerella vaginalis TaxID=2702 RepID=UPI0039F0F5F3